MMLPWAMLPDVIELDEVRFAYVCVYVCVCMHVM